MICSKCKKDGDVKLFVNKFGKQCKTCQDCRDHAKKSKEKNKNAQSLYQKCRNEKKRNNKEVDVFYVRKINDQNEKWQKFTTQIELSKALHLYPSNVNKVINGRMKTTGGYEIKVKKEVYKTEMTDWAKVKKENNIIDQCKGQPSPHRIPHETINGVVGKKCCRCKEWHPLTEYGKLSSHWDKLRSDCKPCLKKQNEQNKEKRTAYNKQYWQKTMDAQKEKSKQWRENNPERVKENMKRWLENNVEYKKQKDKEYRKANYEKFKEIHRMWMKQHYHKLKNTPELSGKFAEYKIKYNTSRRIREFLGQKKSRKCLDYVGCDLNKLRIHLETQFTDGMHWRNYGQSISQDNNKFAWHIDHRLPCNAFDLSNPIEQMACFHYKNLQPLWWDDNISKLDTFDPILKKIYLEKFIEIHILP